MKNYLSFFVLLLVSGYACADRSLNQAQIEAISPYLLSAVAETPYSAVIRHTEAKVIEGTDGSQHLYYAEVTDTIRGEHRDRIHYVMSAEPDEALSLDDAEVLITLCINDDGFYWPGTGAQFPAHEQLIQRAKNHVLNASTNQPHFSQCDD
ncbi:hypothetical protein [Thalassolituus pacificus]|uniref:Uncharacterized protein n=1 Tax=Thalassolituus pacificus TaxID=2975440 RepID=A0A9X2WHN3_9GAMM|nr:hypothetical protein [Thalassolituus pacificus]MCT7359937.1 hypothetical protein [Thalassolituus pacificus]